MTLLEKIKDDYAKELYCQDWITLLMEINIKQEELDVHDEIAKRYAKAVLERAAENSKIKLYDGHFKKYSFVKHIQMGANNATIDKQSILNTKID